MAGDSSKKLSVPNNPLGILQGNILGIKIMCKIIFKMFNLCLIFFLLSFLVSCKGISGKPIHKAAYKGDLEKVRKIIDRDTKQINIRDSLGCTPLYLASIKGHTEIVEFLLDNNANIELGNNLGERPLAKAAKFEHYKTVKTLLMHGVKVNCKDKFGRTPLHEAALRHNKEVINILLSYGADVSVRDKYNNTPLHQAVEQDNIDAAKALVEHGADIFAKDNNNQTPKDIALKWGFKELAQYLQTKEDEKRPGVE